ncbi:MAG: lectin like domain-containing protein [Paludibacteraceae bacterium]|nr:lectin like domain-containing protein [Paludibacteraceae bacterium]
MKNIYTILTIAFLLAPMSSHAQMAGGYIPSPVDFHNYSVSHLKTADELPSKYDSRDFGYITESRNQVISGTCWAFATCDAVEALYNKSGHSDGYLSPQLMSNCHYGFLLTKQDGGNFNIATSIMANLQSPAYEESFPYDAYDEVCPDFTPDDFPAYTLGAYFLPSGDMVAIKQCIMDYGAVGASMFYDNKYLSGNVYKYTGEEAANHAVSLIGWDDDERVFLAKFNWGSFMFDNGVLKISYDDSLIMSGCTAFTTRVEKSEVSNAYYYNRSGMHGTRIWSGVDKMSTLSYFTPKSKEKLTYVGAYVTEDSPEITFTVMVGSEVSFTKTIQCPYTGFYSVKLDNPVIVDNTFIVAVDYYSNTVPLESKSDGYNDPTFIPVGSQYIQVNGDDRQTIEIGTDAPIEDFRTVNLCVKAYTTDIPTDEEIIEESLDTVPESVDVYGTDGHFIKNFKSKNDFLSKGLFIFVEHFKDKPQSKGYLEYRP